MNAPRFSLAAVILTKNESVDIVACIQSCSFADEVIVYDSFSTDNTIALARQCNATVHQRAFTNYADQRNAAIAAAGHHSWVLMVDADERVPESLATEIVQRIHKCSAQTAMFCMRRKDYLQDRWLRRSSGYPTWFARLFRPTDVRFTRDINETAETSGAVEYLNQQLEHFPFSKGVAYWIERHNSYSSLEASRLLAESETPISLWCNFRDPTQRRKVMKQIFYRLPFRPMIAFLGLYICRGGFLDGRAGLQYCRLRSIYEYMIHLKITELKRKRLSLGS